MSRSRRGTRLAFEAKGAAPPPASLEVLPVRFDVPVADRPSPLTVDLTPLPDVLLVRQLGRGLLARFTSADGARSSATLETYVHVLRRFVGWLTAHHPRARDLADLRAPMIDAFEAALHAEIPRTGHHVIKYLVTLLRTAAERTGAGLDSRMRERLAFSSRRDRPRARPLDAYSPYVIKQIRAGCKRLMRATVQRLTVEGPALLARGADPRGAGPGGWDAPENVLWEINRVGRLPHPVLLATGSVIARRRGCDALHALLYPDVRDLYPFLVLLCLTARLPPESASSLEVDALTQQPGDDWGRLAYTKRRAQRGEDSQTRYVRATGAYSPGGIIRTVLRLTQDVRRHHPSTELWIGYAASGARPGFGRRRMKRHPLRKWFCRAIALTNDDGVPMRSIDLRRLRKSGKKDRYIEVGGHIANFADDHSPQVAFTHYADIPALRGVHEATVARALEKSLAAAQRPTVLAPAEEAALLADPAAGAAALGVAEGRVLPILRGEHDVWLSACKDITKSPFAAEGVLCPATAWGCLSCGNAVITSRKLPNLVAHLDFLCAQRMLIDVEVWVAVYGVSYVRTTEYLACFPAAELMEARAVAEATERLLHVGIELQSLAGSG